MLSYQGLHLNGGGERFGKMTGSEILGRFIHTTFQDSSTWSKAESLAHWAGWADGLSHDASKEQGLHWSDALGGVAMSMGCLAALVL